MSNIGSSAMQSKQHTQTHPNIPSTSPAQKQFNAGTRNMLDEARGVVENAVGQGQELNPMIYQMLGLEPQYEDHSADLQTAQQEFDAAQGQYNTAKETVSSLSGIPKAQRSHDQRVQLRQLTKQMPVLEKSLGTAKTAFGQLETMPKTITGLSRLDPTKIPAESPFSAANPLNQAQTLESARLNQYLGGTAEVDPTLVHQYDSAEASLRAKLSQRFGPDYESSSVGQMALQNFSRQKNEAYATWNQQQVEKYNQLAFAGQANLQALLSNRINMLREPATNQQNEAASLANIAGARNVQQQTYQQLQLGQGGVTTNATGMAPIGPMAAGGLASLLTTPYNKQGSTLAGAVTGTNPSAPAANTSGLSTWAAGGAAAGAGSAAADAAVADAAASDAAAGAFL